MQKIDKSYDSIFSTKYKEWVDNLEKKNKKHPDSRTYYDDIVMELHRCQKGVCAYTEIPICIPELYQQENWQDGKYDISSKEYKRTDHFGELEHFNPDLKENQYWLWDNLFMIHSTINSRKSDKTVITYLKPDLTDYSPEKYFEYDDVTHRFVPNTDIEDETQIKEIQYMIDEVLYLNHGVVRKERENFIKEILQKIKFNQTYIVDRFFTATSWCLEEIEQ
ncbi:hypothetical protein [Emticicia agri]|uniref:TIGR02646 family protein n=1 Tax=Emticicia agri TaxID=2492393 RepID=A0A4Q5M418_9BACT|nr:hypothetical protein [Emticicia agri]RYU97088.1 hypothetical protein EWM59_04050 [Emticicia agri]